MDGARYLEDGKLTFLKRSGVYLRTHSHRSIPEVHPALAEDLK